MPGVETGLREQGACRGDPFPDPHAGSMASPLLTLQARLAAPGALQALNRAANWTVLQVHPDACNLVAEPDYLVALVRPQAGAGPFSIVVDLAERRDGFTEFTAEAGRAEVHDGMLILGSLRIRLEGVELWQPRPAWEALRNSGNLPRWLGPLAELLQVQAPPDSLAEGLEAILGGRSAKDAASGDLGREPPHIAASDLGWGVLQAAVAGGRDLIVALAQGDLKSVAGAAGRLAGLGAGLTPAGDDFLVGAMLALWSRADPGWAEQAGRALLQAAGPRTNRISRAWLAAAAAGQAGEAWHALVRAMIDQADPAVRQAAGRIIRQGHTSGADALTGYLAVASKTAPGSGAA